MSTATVNTDNTADAKNLAIEFKLLNQEMQKIDAAIAALNGAYSKFAQSAETTLIDIKTRLASRIDEIEKRINPQK
jgi:prefoldin subunit 5